MEMEECKRFVGNSCERKVGRKWDWGMGTLRIWGRPDKSLPASWKLQSKHCLLEESSIDQVWLGPCARVLLSHWLVPL